MTMSVARRNQSHEVSHEEFQSAANQTRETLKGLANTLNSINGPAASIDDIVIVQDSLYHRHASNKVMSINPVQIRATRKVVEALEDERARQTAILIREGEETHFTGALASALVSWSRESLLSRQITTTFGNLFPGQSLNDDLIALCKQIAAALLTVEYMNSKHGSQHPNDALTFCSHVMIKRLRENLDRRVGLSTKVIAYPNSKAIEIIANGFENNAELMKLLGEIPNVVQEDFIKLPGLLRLPAVAKTGQVEALSAAEVKEVLMAALGAIFAYAILVIYKDPALFLTNPAIVKGPAPNREFHMHIAEANR